LRSVGQARPAVDAPDLLDLGGGNVEGVTHDLHSSLDQGDEAAAPQHGQRRVARVFWIGLREAATIECRPLSGLDDVRVSAHGA
jgi:hypothetical protein